MEREIRLSCEEVKAKLLDAIEKMSAEECKELVRELTASILEQSGTENVKVKANSKQPYEVRVLSLLTTLGMPTHILGYSYTKTAIMYLHEYKQKPGAKCSVTKELYPRVAEMFATTGSRVERSIRHAVEVTWDRADMGVLKEIFGYTVSSNKGKPTNSEFLSMIVEYLNANDN